MSKPPSSKSSRRASVPLWRRCVQNAELYHLRCDPAISNETLQKLLHDLDLLEALLIEDQ